MEVIFHQLIAFVKFVLFYADEDKKAFFTYRSNLMVISG